LRGMAGVGAVSAIDTPRVERTLTRRYAPTSPASGRGGVTTADSTK
jgi:hypothetical protein